MLDIAPPPAPQLGWMIDLACAAGGLAAAAGLILRGRALQRPVILLALAGLGALIAGTIAGWFVDADAILILVTAVFVCVIAGLFMAKVAWAAGLAAFVGAVLLTAIAFRFQPSTPPVPHRPADASFSAWAQAAGWTLSDHTARSMWADKEQYWRLGPIKDIRWTDSAWKVQLIVGVAVLVVLILASFIGPLPSVLLCSLLGACCALGGLAMLFDRLWQGFWPWAWNHPVVPGIFLGVLTALGMVLQYRAILRERRAQLPPTPAPAATATTPQ